jgi:hypothetical protein
MHQATVRSLALCTCLVLAAVATSAQDVPSTDIYLVSLEETSEGLPTIGKPRNLTDREGYDNQPHFLDDNTLLYTSMRHGQTDIYRVRLKRDVSRALTLTRDTSEYSPTPMADGEHYSVVRVEADGKQRLWSFPLSGKGEPTLLLPEVEPVGYHAWSGGDELVLFVLGEPHTLERVKLGGEPRVMARNIGRSLHRIPGDKAAFSFIDKGQDGEDEGDGQGTWWLRRLDVASGEISPLIETLPGREDLAWDPQGRAWMADGTRLYRWCPFCGAEWKPVADLATHGLGEITRLAISPDGKSMALVAER